MKILITGANGQLGRELVDLLSKDHSVYGFGKQELDVTNLDQVKGIVTSIKPDTIIHAAAYTNVDGAEGNLDLAFLINAYGARNVAITAQEIGAKLIYISTDYVFSGDQSVPYHEFDKPGPLNVYGKSKLAGEEMVKSFCSKHFIVRTSWLYGKHGKNFVKTIMRIAREKGELAVVNDQVGSPTCTKDLSCFIGQLIHSEKYGIYHASNTGQCSWYEFAVAILEKTGIQARIRPIPAKDYPLPAQRPAFSVLDHLAIKLNGLTDLREWRIALDEYLTEIDPQS